MSEDTLLWFARMIGLVGLGFTHWRILHYGTYLFLVLGLAHSLLISAEYKAGELFDFEEPEKIILLAMGGIALLFPTWRIIAAHRH